MLGWKGCDVRQRPLAAVIFTSTFFAGVGNAGVVSGASLAIDLAVGAFLAACFFTAFFTWPPPVETRSGGAVSSVVS